MRLLTAKVFILLAIDPLPLLAQGLHSSTFIGELFDSQGKALEEVQLILTSQALQCQRQLVTDVKGHCTAPFLPPGDYWVKVHKEGFQNAQIPVNLELGQSYRLKLTLKPSMAITIEAKNLPSGADRSILGTSQNFQMDSTENLNIEGRTPAGAPSTAPNTIPPLPIYNLPLARTPEDILKLMSGCVVDRDSNSARFHGALPSSNLFLVDGQNINDIFTGKRGVQLIEDSLADIQVVTGAASSCFPSTDGGIINIVTKSGGNEYCGSMRLNGKNTSWDALKPMQNKNNNINKFNYDTSGTVGGYFIKDKLWFFLTGYQAKKSIPRTFKRGVNAGLGYREEEEDKMLQIKINNQLGQDDSLGFSSATHVKNQFGGEVDITGTYGAYPGDINALQAHRVQDSCWNFNWKTSISSTFKMELLLGIKKARIRQGGTIPGISPIIVQRGISHIDDSVVYFNGERNANDGGDNRNHKNIKLWSNISFDLFGYHDIGYGFEVVIGSLLNKRDISPTNRVIFVNDLNPFDLINTSKSTNYMAINYISRANSANTSNQGFFLCDQWNYKSININCGVRYECIHANEKNIHLKATAKGWFPQFGLKWDYYGDSSLQMSCSLGRYSALSGGIADIFSKNYFGCSKLYQYTGPKQNADTFYSFAQLQDPNNWKKEFGAAGSGYIYVPSKFQNNLTLPYADEFKFSIVNFISLGADNAFVKVAFNYKKFNKLIDWTAGNHGIVNVDFGLLKEDQYAVYYYNSSFAKRSYKCLELALGCKGRQYDFNGNITWSRLWGNYENLQEGITAFSEISIPGGKTIFNYSWEDMHPNGYLDGHTPLSIRLAGSFHWNWKWGKTTLGMIYTFNSGRHSREYRMVNCDTSKKVSAIRWIKQFNNHNGGSFIQPSTSYTDISIQQDFDGLSLKQKTVRYLLKLNVFNIFNRQQILTYWEPGYKEVTLKDIHAPWIRTSSPKPIEYGNARSLQIETGFKF